MGQGRPRRAQDAEDRPAGARHAVLHPPGFELLRAHHGVDLDASPASRPRTRRSTRCCSDADTIGVFQVESRAQMSMLPRLKPKDVLRPGHRGRDRPPGADPGRHGASLSAPPRGHGSRSTLSRRRHGACEERVLGKTLGVPLVPGAGDEDRDRGRRFTPSEADGLRRAMATFRRSRPIEHLRSGCWSSGMVAARLRRATSPSAASSRSRASATTASRRAMRRASRCWSTSRPGSSAITRTCSAPPSSTPSRWASTPRPSSCATRVDHGVEVREVDVNHSYWDSTLEPRPAARAADDRGPPRLSRDQGLSQGGRRLGSSTARLSPTARWRI